jgi:hypothetical protein
MKKNILFFTALKANDPNMNDYMEWSLLSWKHYAKRHNLDVFIFSDPIEDPEVMRPTWQRWHVHKILKDNGIKYNQIALIDIDTMSRWDTPDIFKLSNDRYSGVKDDISLEWTNNSITGYKKFFPDINLQWTDYVNNGIIVLPKDSSGFCDHVNDFYNSNKEELRDLQHHTLKKGTDQTPVNYMAFKYFGSKINYFPKTFNLGHLHTTHSFEPCMFTGSPIFIRYAYIWHFNALPRESRNQYMKQTWELIKDNYV